MSKLLILLFCASNISLYAVTDEPSVNGDDEVQDEAYKQFQNMLIPQCRERMQDLEKDAYGNLILRYSNGQAINCMASQYTGQYGGQYPYAYPYQPQEKKDDQLNEFIEMTVQQIGDTTTSLIEAREEVNRRQTEALQRRQQQENQMEQQMYPGGSSGSRYRYDDSQPYFDAEGYGGQLKN